MRLPYGDVREKEEVLMNGPSNQPQLTDKLYSLARNGDYEGFLEGLKLLDRHGPSAPSLELLGLRVLCAMGQCSEVYDKACQLKEELVNPLFRKRAELTFLYLDWLLNGRKATQLSKLRQECQSEQTNVGDTSSDLFVQEIQLRLEASLLMLGCRDAGSKADLVSDYECLIDFYVWRGAHQEAFDCMTHLINLVLSKPMANKSEAFRLLGSFMSRDFIKNVPFRHASLKLFEAEMLLEYHLEGTTRGDYQSSYQIVTSLFGKSECRFGINHVLGSKGRTLLKYGHRQGKRFLDRAIQKWESSDHFFQATLACRSVLNWLQKTGDGIGVHTYELKIHENGYKPDSVSSPAFMGEVPTDFALRSSAIIARAEWISQTRGGEPAIAELEDFLSEAESHGQTLHLANLYGALSLHAALSDPECAKTYFKRAIGLYADLGYVREGLLLVSKYLGEARESLNDLCHDQLSEIVELGKKLATVDIDSQETLALIYESAAVIGSADHFHRTSIFLDKAQAIFRQYGLRPRLAFHLMHRGYSSLELGIRESNSSVFEQARSFFKESGQIFRLMGYSRGAWMTELGLAIVNYGHRTTFDQIQYHNCVKNLTDTVGCMYDGQTGKLSSQDLTNLISQSLAKHEGLNLLISNLFQEN